MATKAEIFNMALAHLAVDPVGDPDTDQSAQAKILRSFYTPVLRSCLERFRWGFGAKTSTRLAEAPSDSMEGYKRYVKPAGVRNILGLFEEESGDDVHYREEDGLLVVDEWGAQGSGHLFLRYVEQGAEGTFSDSFVIALSLELALRACMPLTENTALRDSLRDELKDAWRIARSADSQRRGSQPLARAAEYALLSVRR